MTVTAGLAQGAIQTAIVTLLKSTSAVTSLLGGDTTPRIYDAIPDSTVSNYLAIGEWSEFPDDTLEEGNAGIGAECTVTLHAYTDDNRDGAGYKAVQAILSAVKVALHGAALTVTGWTTVTCEHEDTVTMRDEDEAGRPKRHGVSTYRINVEAT